MSAIDEVYLRPALATMDIEQLQKMHHITVEVESGVSEGAALMGQRLQYS